MTFESVYVIIIFVRGNEMEKEVEESEEHVVFKDCYDHAVPYEFYENGHRYHGWECGKCGELLQTG